MLEHRHLGASRARGMEAASFGPSRCIGREGEEGEAQAREGRERRRPAAGGVGEAEDETRRRHGVFFLREGSRWRIGRPRIYLLGRLRKRSRIAARETERKPVEGKKERRELLLAKATPSFLGHRMEDPTDDRNGGDVDACSIGRTKLL